MPRVVKKYTTLNTVKLEIRLLLIICWHNMCLSKNHNHSCIYTKIKSPKVKKKYSAWNTNITNFWNVDYLLDPLAQYLFVWMLQMLSMRRQAKNMCSDAMYNTTIFENVANVQYLLAQQAEYLKVYLKHFKVS